MDYDDVTVMNDIIQDVRGKTGNVERKNYAQRIVERNHHRVVYETSDQADAKERRIAINIEKTLGERYPKVDFILDLKAEGKVHKFFVRGEEEYGDEFPIYNTVSGQYLTLSEESSIFEKIPKTFHVIRIYADVPKDRLAELRKETTEIARQEREVI